MDRNTAVVPKQQLGFYNFVARPMFEALDGLVSMADDIMYAHWSEKTTTTTFWLKPFWLKSF